MLDECVAAWRYWNSSSCIQANPGTGVRFSHSNWKEHLAIIALQMRKGELVVTVKDDATSTRVTRRLGLFSERDRSERFFCALKHSDQLLGSTHPSYQWVSGDCVLGIKWPKPKTDHSSPASDWVKNAWSYNSTHQHTLAMITGRILCRLVTVWPRSRLQFTVCLLTPCSLFPEWLIRLFVGYWFARNSSVWLNNWLLFLLSHGRLIIWQHSPNHEC
jgi:hypothetical protein